ncbi:ROK family protein [Aerococcaceae bacterium zg-BR22]|uniref:ROK family protein n=1 Tax=Aerococcaceae bacterium zg-1292 TaxID=2774330 RepID=UPI0040631D7F|nr:ROK family protein [Aerococcaceae bacterium zg-BR22]
MKVYLVIDVGGTYIKFAKMTEDGRIIDSGKVVTPKDSLELFWQLIDGIIDAHRGDIAGVAFSIPGKVDTKEGTVYFGGSLPYLHGEKIAEKVSEKYGLKCAVQNDAKAAALAELWQGSLKNVKDAAVIVLGTGVGGGIILDGKIRYGSHFQAGEFSLSILDASKDGADKIMGLIGSAVEMVRRVNRTLGNEDEMDGVLAFEGIKQKHPEAMKIFEQYCLNIAYLIVNIQSYYDLEVYAIGGGISAQNILVEEIQRQYQTFLDSAPLLKMNFPKIEIKQAHFANDANLYGALYTLLEEIL